MRRLKFITVVLFAMLIGCSNQTPETEVETLPTRSEAETLPTQIEVETISIAHEDTDLTAEHSFETTSYETTCESETEVSTEVTTEVTTEVSTEVSSELVSILGSGTTMIDYLDPALSVVQTSNAIYSYDQMVADLFTLQERYPDRVQISSAFGATVDGRTLYTAKVGNVNADRQIVIVAATHAREYMTTQLLMKQLEAALVYEKSGTYQDVTYESILNRTCFVLLPMVNPDGVTISQFGIEGLYQETTKNNVLQAYNNDVANGTATGDFAAYLKRWKANGNGVDLNRNFSPGWELVYDRTAPSSTWYKGTAPGSENETMALMNLVNAQTNPVMVVSYHSYGSLVYWQYGQSEPYWSANAELANRISALTGYYTAGYSNEAGFSNWCILEKGIISVTVETGSVECPLPIEQFSEIWAANRNMWWMLGTNY